MLVRRLLPVRTTLRGLMAKLNPRNPEIFSHRLLPFARNSKYNCREGRMHVSKAPHLLKSSDLQAGAERRAERAKNVIIRSSIMPEIESTSHVLTPNGLVFPKGMCVRMTMRRSVKQPSGSLGSEQHARCSRGWSTKGRCTAKQDRESYPSEQVQVPLSCERARSEAWPSKPHGSSTSPYPGRLNAAARTAYALLHSRQCAVGQSQFSRMHSEIPYSNGLDDKAGHHFESLRCCR